MSPRSFRSLFSCIDLLHVGSNWFTRRCINSCQKITYHFQCPPVLSKGLREGSFVALGGLWTRFVVHIRDNHELGYLLRMFVAHVFCLFSWMARTGPFSFMSRLMLFKVTDHQFVYMCICLFDPH